jgi:hypothetical protein
VVPEQHNERVIFDEILCVVDQFGRFISWTSYGFILFIVDLFWVLVAHWYARVSAALQGTLS